MAAKRSFKTIVVLATIGAAAWAGFWLLAPPLRGIQVGTGVVSHTLCSGVFVSGLDPDRLYAEAVEPAFGQNLLSKHLKYQIDRKERQVTVAWAGLFMSRAVYRDGLGCMILHGPTNRDAATYTLNAGMPGAVASPKATTAFEVQPPNPAIESALDRAFAESSQQPPRQVKAILILHKGRVVGERYAPGYDANTPILGYSLAKSVTNAMIGILVRQGKLSVAERAPVSAWSNPSDPRHAITIDQLLRMTSGLALEESDSGADPVSRMLFLESDMAGFAERAPLEAVPGSKWQYSSGNTLVLSRIIRDAVGGHAQDVVEFAQTELFGPLGVTTATIEFDATGTAVGSMYIYASARDWARFGSLFLNDGVIDGKRILPVGWVNYSASPTLDTDYGAGFWTNRGEHGDAKDRIEGGMPADSFYASGNLGQRIFIAPSEDLVIVRLGLTHSPGQDMKGLVRLAAEIPPLLSKP